MADVKTEVAGEGLSESDASSKRVGQVAWGLLLVWTGAVVLLHWGWGVGAIGAGVILLGAQAARRSLRLEVEWFGLVAGALFVISGVGSVFEVAIDFFPLLLIVAGIALLVSGWKARTPGARPGLPAPTHPRL